MHCMQLLCNSTSSNLVWWTNDIITISNLNDCSNLTMACNICSISVSHLAESTESEHRVDIQSSRSNNTDSVSGSSNSPERQNGRMWWCTSCKIWRTYFDIRVGFYVQNNNLREMTSDLCWWCAYYSYVKIVRNLNASRKVQTSKNVVHWYEINNLKKLTCFQSRDLSAVGALIIVFCFGNPIHSGMLSFE